MPTVISENVFELFTLLIPRFLFVFESVELKLDQLFILMYIHHFGNDIEGRRVVLRDAITKALDGPRSDSDVSRAVTVLVDEGYIMNGRISKGQKKRMFGEEKGRRDTLILEGKGKNFLEQLYNQLNGLLDDTPLGNTFLDISEKIAPVNTVSQQTQQKLDTEIANAIPDTGV